VKMTTLLNRDLSAAVAALGHTDMILVGDAGCPMPAGAQPIDLAVRPGLPTVPDLLQALVSELGVEAYYVAIEMEDANPEGWASCERLMPSVERRAVPHADLMRLAGVRYAVRTGDVRRYGNVILVSGPAPQVMA
jgi:D-ribose pyranase